MIAAYVFFLVFPLLLSFYLSFNNVFYNAVRTQGVTNPVTLPPYIVLLFHCM